MKFTVSSGSLLKQLQIISGVISSKVVIPILEYLLFEIEKDKLKIVGTDLEVSIQGTMTIESDEKGKIALPAKLIIEILRTLPEQPVTFTINEKNNAVELTSESGKYKISGEVAEDFPKFPSIDDAAMFTIPGEILQGAIRKTIFAIATDELKPALNGLYLDLNNKDVRFVSTDGNKLVKYQRNDIEIETPTSFILPKKALNVLRNSLLPEEETSDVEVRFNKVNTMFTFKNTTIVCRLIDEKFPDYNSAIPVDLPFKLRVNRLELVDSLRRISIFANKTTYQVKFKIESSVLHLNAQDLDYANEAYEKMNCEYEGEEMEIGFSAKYLGEMLSCLDSEEVVLSLSAHNRPGTIAPAEKSDNEDIIMLLMPIIVKFDNPAE